MSEVSTKKPVFLDSQDLDLCGLSLMTLSSELPHYTPEAVHWYCIQKIKECKSDGSQTSPHMAVPNSSNTSHYFAKGADFLQPQGAALQSQQGLRYQGDSYRILMCLDIILVGRYQSSCRCLLGQS